MGGSGRVSVLASRSESLDIIVVRDSGPGIAPDVRPQLFEPLFTTKAKGTGLGLTICRQILERHGGTIDLLDDSPGASFRICIPRPGDDLSGPASGP
jgi:signal transduction histidine kinase